MKKILVSFLTLGLVLTAGAQNQKVVRNSEVQAEYSTADKALKKSKVKKEIKRKPAKNNGIRTINTSKARKVEKPVPKKDRPVEATKRHDFD